MSSNAIAWGIIMGGIGRFLLFLLFESGFFRATENDTRAIAWVTSMVTFSAYLIKEHKWGIAEIAIYLGIVSAIVLLTPKRR